MKFFFTLIFSIVALSCLAQENFEVNNLRVVCDPSIKCNQFNKRVSELVGKYNSRDHFRDTVRIVIPNQDIKQFYYEVNKTEGKYQVLFYVSFHLTLESVSFSFNNPLLADQIDQDFLNFEQGDRVDFDVLKSKKALIESKIEEMGYESSSVEVISKEISAERVNVTFNITAASLVLLKKIEVKTQSQVYRDQLKRYLLTFINKPINLLEVTQKLADFEARMTAEGYYFVKAEILDVKKLSPLEKVMQVGLSLGPKFSLRFDETTQMKISHLFPLLRERIRESRRLFDESFLKNQLIEILKEHAFFSPEISIRKNKQFKNTFFISVLAGERKKLNGIYFLGNKFFTDTQLEKSFYSQATTLIGKGFYDEKYVENFKRDLSEKYISKGFVSVKVSEPFLRKDGYVQFRLNEGVQCKIRSIKFKGVPFDLRRDLNSKISFKVGDNLNPFLIDREIQKLLKFARSKGYYYSSISDYDPSSVVHYQNGLSEADIKLNFELGPQIRLRKFIVWGNQKTKTKVIERELLLQQGDILTEKKVKTIRARLLSLGLFTEVSVYPVESSVKRGLADVVVSVTEGNFGTFEFAPGFRSDLGAKMSTGISYNNLGGMNRSASLEIQVNRRINNTAFDARRRRQEAKKVELRSKLNYQEPYLFGIPLTYNASAMYSRKRYFSFDADVNRLSQSISKRFGRLTSSLRYQFETISQFDATDPVDNDNFKIGGVTPSFAMDFRDNRVFPRKGVLSSLSVEYAAPELGSQETDDLKIHFYKWISRNFVYFPIANHVLALSFAVGYQKNLADRGVVGNSVGRIPRIKVFRLSGLDNVRGFEDPEINRLLSSGRDISEETIRDEVYFTNIKVEPRYFFTDQVVFAPFWDAGSVQLNHFEPLRFRSSVGLSVKYITPVGSLELSYGFKTHRKKIAPGQLESPGRIHLSIGFF